MERDKNKPLNTKTPETSRSSTSTRPSVKTTKEKLVKEEIDTSHLSTSIPKNDMNTSALSIVSPNNGKMLDQKTSMNNTIYSSSPEIYKNDKNDNHSEKISAYSSSDSAVPSSSIVTVPANQAILSTPPQNVSSSSNSTSTHQASATNSQASPSSSVNLKNLKRKDNTPLSPKGSTTSKDIIRTLRQVPSPKSYLKIKSERQDKSKKKLTTYIPTDSPGKDGASKMSGMNTSQETIPDSYSVSQPGSAQNKISEEFVNYYKQERPKLNVWTYLFKNLNNSISQIYTMCDLENSTQFNNGVISTLETALEDMKKLNKKIELDNIKENKPITWEIPGNSSEIQNKQEIENFLEDIENPDTVDFTLLTQLIQDGKMSLQEAIVLVVRERAMLIDDTALNMMTNSQGFHSDNLSFTSKIGHDFSLEFQKDLKDTKDSKEESLIPPFPIVSEGQELLRRSRSSTPGRISLVKLINRLNWKLQDKKKDPDEGYASEDYTVEEIKKNRLTQKQLRAESNRKELETVRHDYLQKELSKITEAREKVAKQQTKKIEAFSKKQGDAEGRYEAKLTEKKRKAKNESDKVNEVAFISILEKQNKKLTLDQKVKETRDRRLNIIENIKLKIGERSLKEDAASKRRAAQQKETEGRLRSKLEEAENRRNKIYEEKKKIFSEESKKMLEASNKKKLLGYKDTHMKKGEEQTFKSRVDHLRVILLEEQQKLNRRLTKRDAKVGHSVPKPRKLSILDTSEDDLSFVRAKRARSVRTEDENEGSIILGDQPIVFYEPRSKEKASSKIEIKTPAPASAGEKTQAKKGKKKKKKKDIEVIQKEEEEDKFKNLYVLIRSFSQPNMRTPKLKDLRLKLEAAEEKKASITKIQKPATAPSLTVATTKKPEKVETHLKSAKDQKMATKHADADGSAVKKNITKQKSIGSSSSDALHSVLGEEKKSSRGVTIAQSSNTVRRERSSILDKEESTAEPDAASIGNVTAKEKEMSNSMVHIIDRVAGDADDLERMDQFDATVKEDDQADAGAEEGKDASPGCSSDDKMIRWCSICDFILEAAVGNDEHIASKQHRKVKIQYNLSYNDDTNCILEFKTSDINSKLKTERWNTLKKRCKKIKQRLVTRALKRENSMAGGKEVTSINKQRLQKLCLDLDKQVATQIKDYEAVDSTLKDILKLLDNQKEADLHIMRQLKFVPILMEICKRVSVCHKNEIDNLLKALDSAIKILTKFCGLIDNRTYMIVTNRLVPLVDLLIWCLNRPTKFVYSLTFVPHLFTILGRHLSQRLHPENAGYKEDVIEYIFCSGVIVKLQQKFMSFNGGLDLTTSMGKVPLALLKSVSFLEVLTGVVDAEHNTERSIFDPPTVSENIMIALKETEFIGMFSLLASLLLSDGSYIKQPNKVMPQTVLSVAMTTVKFFNNVARIMLEPFQSLLGSKELQEQVYHVFGFLLTYCTMNYDNSEDVKDLLDELLLMIGYFCVLNTNNQEILGKGMSTVIEKLNALPFPFFTDKKMKDILFPTLLCAVYQVERNLEIVYQEVSKEHLDKFLQSQMQLYPLDFITEKEESHFTASNQDLSLNSNQLGNEVWNNKPQEMKFLKGPLSHSSNTSSTTSLFNVKASNSHHFSLICRFPRNRWDELLKFIHSK